MSKQLDEIVRILMEAQEDLWLREVVKVDTLKPELVDWYSPREDLGISVEDMTGWATRAALAVVVYLDKEARVTECKHCGIRISRDGGWRDDDGNPYCRSTSQLHEEVGL